jgi:hypothetical protein
VKGEGVKVGEVHAMGMEVVDGAVGTAGPFTLNPLNS